MKCHRLIIIALLGLLVLSAGGLGPHAHASSSSQITMTIRPLECDIDTVHDGIKQITRVKSKQCQRALNGSL